MLRTASLLTLVAPLALAACDSPGGGGGRAPLDCNATPNVPACQDTRGDTTSGDTTTSDTGPGDTNTPVDTTPVDTAGPEDTTPPVDTTPVDTFVPPSCENGQRRCDGQKAQLCSGGNWTTTETCSGTRVCEAGSCVQTSVCTNNQRRCAGSAVEVCTGGQWQAQSTCPTGCTNGECNPATGNDDCLAILGCGDSSGCWDTPPTNQACFNQCLASGSTIGKSEATSVIACYDNCNWDAVCAYSTCSPQRAACFFAATGTKTCKQIDECIGTCASGDDACVDACYESGSAQAQSRYLWLNACLGLYCDAGDTACYNQVLGSGQPCATAYTDCFP